ncbi:HNH endonuclease [Ramlibacter sp. GTP1]|uniref:HNH endonuclease n=2 Tax=Ramlibacter albus TaxID=2079448 RepID=A0A923S101_9BURK|nr:HNH endonuclease [Ramlibacter albus]
MWRSDPSAFKTFAALRTSAEWDGSRVYVAVDGVPAPELAPTTEPWRKIEIEASKRIVAAKVTDNDVFDTVLECTSVALGLTLSLLVSEEVVSAEDDVRGLPEGARTRIEVNRYERSPANRAACIAHHGLVCKACGFDFGAFYGDLGSGYIQVHHRVPVSKMGEDYFVNPVADLIPVCANCHAMLHRSDPPMEVEELARRLKQ